MIGFDEAKSNNIFVNLSIGAYSLVLFLRIVRNSAHHIAKRIMGWMDELMQPVVVFKSEPLKWHLSVFNQAFDDGYVWDNNWIETSKRAAASREELRIKNEYHCCRMENGEPSGKRRQNKQKRNTHPRKVYIYNKLWHSLRCQSIYK